MTVITKFKSISAENKWIEFHNEKAELLKKKSSQKTIDRIEILNSLMTSCKPGFNIPEAKVKKVIKFLKEKFGDVKVKYGNLPEELEKLPGLFKDVKFSYVEIDGQIIFKENG